MCLSIAYKNKVAPENILMRNVVSAQYVNGCLQLTDLMERKLNVDGQIEFVHLTDDYMVIRTSEK